MQTGIHKTHTHELEQQKRNTKLIAKKWSDFDSKEKTEIDENAVLWFVYIDRTGIANVDMTRVTFDTLAKIYLPGTTVAAWSSMKQRHVRVLTSPQVRSKSPRNGTTTHVARKKTLKTSSLNCCGSIAKLPKWILVTAPGILSRVQTLLQVIQDAHLIRSIFWLQTDFQIRAAALWVQFEKAVKRFSPWPPRRDKERDIERERRRVRDKVPHWSVVRK